MKSVTVYTTSECNIRCKHCGVGMDQYKPRTQQTTEELKKIITELAKGGAKFVTILGGEPTIYRPDLKEILDLAYEVGIKVTINTNLTSFDAVEPLLDNPGLNSFVVSLDGASKETHDYIRGKGTFKTTTDNLRILKQHKRVVSNDLFIEMAFVMTGSNYHEIGNLIPLALELGARQLNVKSVRMVGRAEKFKKAMVFSSSELLNAYCKLIIGWMMAKKKVDLEVFVPPAFATYLNKRFGLSFPISERAACGGDSVYSYVDLYGNHLPCPSMSYEEDMKKGFKRRVEKLNLVTGTIEKSFESDVFQEFEKNRVERKYTNQLYPCKYCKFNTQCRQCVADIIAGQSDVTIDICAAVYENGNETLPGIKEEIWCKTPPVTV